MSGFQVNKTDLQEARNCICKYKYALLYYASETVLQRTDYISEINWEDLQEAYFFDESGQMHISDNGREMQAVEFVPGDAPYVEKKYNLVKRHEHIGKKVVIREYLDADDDGQCFVAYTALYGVA